MLIEIPSVDLTPARNAELYAANLKHLASSMGKVPLNHVATVPLPVDDPNSPVPTNRHYRFGDTTANGSIYVLTRYEEGLPRITVLYSLHGVTMEVSFNFTASPYLDRYIDACQAIETRQGLRALETEISVYYRGR